MSECTLPSCPKPLYALDWCNTHYNRVYRFGHPLPVELDPFFLFWSRVEQQGDCWIWVGGKTERGYGRWSKNRIRVHRYSYRVWVGPIPSWLELDHLCQTLLCVNPAHLEAVTHLENVRRGRAGEYNRNKTQCPQGHPYSEENTFYYTDGSGRGCRECMRVHTRETRRRRKEKVMVGV